MNRQLQGYSQLSLKADDINKLRELKELGIISSMSSFVHFLIMKEIQQLKKQRIIRKRKNREDRKMQLTDNYDVQLENYINNYNDYMERLGFSPVYDKDGIEIMGWEK